ncbi:MAG: transporter substrate-binding domain-containing protein [Rhodospirillales bacterium]|nr:transporter substrate-binding domain-containing protein [Alphaproteobacteria bacterium]MCB9986664.1 transporter substrate-binding domain-containing protein [Rhodospirillales bacterium]USO06809.1 MAG: transporter substrate-binding domain-containing protein [Rhodospirillales bacterium]
MRRPAVEGHVVMQELYTKKGDAMLGNSNIIIEYNKANPVKLRLVAPQDPVKVMPAPLAVAPGDFALKAFLDNAIQNLENDGTMDRIISKWETEPGLFLRPAKPYEAAK